MINKDQTPPELKERKDQLHLIKAVGDTPGGKELVSLLLEDVVGSVHRLIGGADTTKEISDMRARLELVQLIRSAEENEKHLDTLIKEALSE